MHSEHSRPPIIVFVEIEPDFQKLNPAQKHPSSKGLDGEILLEIMSLGYEGDTQNWKNDI